MMAPRRHFLGFQGICENPRENHCHPLGAWVSNSSLILLFTLWQPCRWLPLRTLHPWALKQSTRFRRLQSAAAAPAISVEAPSSAWAMKPQRRVIYTLKHVDNSLEPVQLHLREDSPLSLALFLPSGMIPVTASAAVVEAALNSLWSIKPDSVKVTKQEDSQGSHFTVTFNSNRGKGNEANSRRPLVLFIIVRTLKLN